MNSDASRSRAARNGRGPDRPPGWADSLTAGRSRADKETDRDALGKAVLLAVAVLGPVILLAHAILTAAGLRFGWWSAPVFAPVLVWFFISAASSRALRPLELDGLRWPARLGLAGVLAVVFFACWGLWAGSAARAWKSAHGGFATAGGPRFPFHAVLSASPVLFGFLAFLALALGMALAPNFRDPSRATPRPPAGPEPVRPPLVTEGRQPQRPRWP
jgi:hypothetical protein